MFEKELSQQDFEKLLNDKPSTEREYILFTRASAQQLKELFARQRLSPCYEAHLHQLFEESSDGVVAVCEYFSRYELSAEILMEIIKTHNSDIIRFYIGKHPLPKEAVAYLKTGVIQHSNELLELYYQEMNNSLSALSMEEFADYVRKNELSRLQIKKLIDDNNLVYLKIFFEDSLDEKNVEKPLPFDMQEYILENGSEKLVGMFISYYEFAQILEKRLLDRGNKFLVLLYIINHALYEENEMAFIQINDLSLITYYEEHYMWHSDEALEAINALVDQGLL